jgi:hypothetical protein
MNSTRERISIKHLKGLDLVQREFNKIMPNNLTQRVEPLRSRGGPIVEDLKGMRTGGDLRRGPASEEAAISEEDDLASIE